VGIFQQPPALLTEYQRWNKMFFPHRLLRRSPWLFFSKEFYTSDGLRNKLDAKRLNGTGSLPTNSYEGNN
jgi:hypothetical protein